MSATADTVTAPRPRSGGPRPVFCVTEGEHRELAVAEAVAAGRYTHVGITCQLGVEPDWLDTAALPADEEWRIEWSKFYYGRDLAHGFAVTGERRFLDAWERLVGSWIEQVPADHDVADVAGRRLQNWIYAWQDFAAVPGFDGLSGDLDARLRASIAEQARHVRDNLHAQRNHRTLELYALLIVALALPQADDADELCEFALEQLGRNLHEDFRADGVHVEASTHYHMIAMRSFVGARENARRFGLRMPDGFDEHLNRACDFALHCTRPDGGIPALSDADGGDYGALLALAADALDRDDLRYVATGGKDGTPPRERHASFPDGGYHVQRSGWAGPAERYMIFDCGPLGDGGHGHYDALSFELAAGGRPLIVDPGRYTYAEETPNLRRWFKSTAAHNTVCVDGLDQTPYRRGRPSAAVADARLRGRFTAPRLDVLCGEATSPAYSAVHRRTIAFVDDAYWVVLDRLHDELPRRYDARLHLGPDAQARTDVHRGEGQTTVRTPHLALCFAGDAEVALEDGWVAPLYGVRHEAPVVSASIEARSAALTTLVAPMERGQSSPHMSVECQDAWIVVNLNGLFADGHEVIALADTSAPLQLGPLHGRARAVWMRFSADGACVALSACEVSSLTLGDSFDVSADAAQPLASLAWEAGAGLSLGGRAS